VEQTFICHVLSRDGSNYYIVVVSYVKMKQTPIASYSMDCTNEANPCLASSMWERNKLFTPMAYVEMQQTVWVFVIFSVELHIVNFIAICIVLS
jgi:hypothetical protein